MPFRSKEQEEYLRRHKRKLYDKWKEKYGSKVKKKKKKRRKK